MKEKKNEKKKEKKNDQSTEDIKPIKSSIIKKFNLKESAKILME